MMPPKKDDKIDEDWMSTYSDMVTLLLCFFVMMMAVSKVDVVLFEQIKQGISQEWKKEPVEQPVAMLSADLAEDITMLSSEMDITLGNDQAGLTLEIPAAAFFDSGSARLKPQALNALNKIMSTIKAPRYNKFRFEIQGHTDDSPINTPAFPSNWELSAGRAAAVVRYFTDNNMNPERFRAVGMADIQPKYPNNDAYGQPIPHNQERNRRVVIRMEPTFYH